jgi:hypothetical protein
MEETMSQHLVKFDGRMIGLLVPALMLGLSACAMPAGDNTATNDMVVRWSELGLPKHAVPKPATASCIDAAQQAKAFDGVPRPDYSRCPSRVYFGG